MYVSPSQARKLSAVFELLTESQASPCSGLSLRERLIEPIAQLLNADYVASLVWDEQHARFKEGVCVRGDSGHLAAYEAQFQFSDPIAPRLRPLHYPTRVSQVIPQHDLVKSDFFNCFLQPGGMYWGLNIFAHNGVSDLGDFRIWRAKSKNNYDSNELEMLRLLYPSLVNSLGATLSVASMSVLAAPRTTNQTAAAQIEVLMYKYALSHREMQVVGLVATGASDKLIAKQLAIGFASVRTYLRNALQKMGLHNRKELIASFNADLRPSNHS